MDTFLILGAGIAGVCAASLTREAGIGAERWIHVNNRMETDAEDL